MVAQLLPPVVTAIGRYGVPYLFKEYIKKGASEFSNVYGSSALQSINTLGAQNEDLFNQEFANYNDESGDKDEQTPTLFDEKPKTPDPKPPKGPDLGPELATEAALQVSKKLSESDQTKKALEPKVEFGPLTETQKQTAKALMGNQPEFYSRVVKSIKDAKPDKLTKNKWKSFIQGDKQELKFLGLDKFLQGNESITKKDLLDFVDQTNFASQLNVVEVPLEDQYDFTQYSIGGAGGKRAGASESTRRILGAGDVKLPTMEGYKSTVKQYVFQVSSFEGPFEKDYLGTADTAHFSAKYALNALAHARAQIGYFDPDAVEKRLNAKEADGVELTIEDKTLKNASRQLEDTFIIDEIQSDMVQDRQKEGTKEDFIIIKGSDITSDFLKKFYPDYTVRPTPVNILTGKSDEQLKDEGLITIRNNPNVLYVTDRTTGTSSPEVRLMDNNFYVFNKNNLVGKGSYKTEEAAQKLVDERGLNPLPITESKKYVELVLNSMIKKAVEEDLDSIGITNGQIQYDRYVGQPIEDKEGLKKFYDEIVFKQLEKIANKYNVKLETVELPGKAAPKEFDDVGLNEPTEEGDARQITRRTTRALRDGFVLRKVNANTLAATIHDLVNRTFEDPSRYNDPNAVLPDYASIFTATGRGIGENILENLIIDNPDFDESEKKNYYMWVKPGSAIEKALQEPDNYGSLSGVWDIRDINLQMPIASVSPEGGTDINRYNSFISDYFDETGPDLKYMHEIIKMRIPKQLQKDILSKPIKLSKANKQTGRLLA